MRGTSSFKSNILCAKQVVFSASQLSWFTVEQAWAVTEDQWVELNSEQKLAVQRARYEGDVLLELRGACTHFRSHCNKCSVLVFMYNASFI